MPELKSHKVSITVLAVTTILAIFLAAIAWGLIKNHGELSQIKEAQTQEAQFLLATVDFATEQQRLTLYIRDIVFDEWKRIKYKGSYDKSFIIASTIVKEATKYPYIPVDQYALFMTSIQYQESCFKDSAKSEMDAKGIAQFSQTTGRMVARMLGMEFNDSLLFNAEASIRMQAVFLDILMASNHQNVELVAAEYNGGTKGPWYWAHDKSKLSNETLKYVPEVVSRYKGYLEAYKTYRVALKASPTSSP